MPVVTIAGQSGAGREVGQKVASLLGADYVDRQILAEAAERLGATIEAVAQKDERPSTLGERISHLLQSFLEKSAAAGSAGDPFMGPTGVEVLLARTYEEAGQSPITRAQELDDARFLEITQAVIRDLAKTGNVVIVGRGGQIILKDVPHTLHVYLVAPHEIRVDRVMGREKVDREAAEKIVKETDHHRAAYIKKFFKVDADDPLIYDVVINTAKLSTEKVAQVIADMAKGA